LTLTALARHVIVAKWGCGGAARSPGRASPGFFERTPGSEHFTPEMSVLTPKPLLFANNIRTVRLTG